jgi:hypothetical protein
MRTSLPSAGAASASQVSAAMDLPPHACQTVSKACAISVDGGTADLDARVAPGFHLSAGSPSHFALTHNPETMRRCRRR